MVTVVSVLMIIFGILLVLLSLDFESKDGILNADLGSLNPDIKNVREIIFLVIMVFALITIVLGGFGSMCLAPCCNKCGFAVVFGVMLLFMWIVFITVGGVVTTVSVVG